MILSSICIQVGWYCHYNIRSWCLNFAALCENSNRNFKVACLTWKSLTIHSIYLFSYHSLEAWLAICNKKNNGSIYYWCDLFIFEVNWLTFPAAIFCHPKQHQYQYNFIFYFDFRMRKKLISWLSIKTSIKKHAIFLFLFLLTYNN